MISLHWARKSKETKEEKEGEREREAGRVNYAKGQGESKVLQKHGAINEARQTGSPRCGHLKSYGLSQTCGCS